MKNMKFALFLFVNILLAVALILIILHLVDIINAIRFMLEEYLW